MSIFVHFMLVIPQLSTARLKPSNLNLKNRNKQTNKQQQQQQQQNPNKSTKAQIALGKTNKNFLSRCSLLGTRLWGWDSRTG